MSEPQVLVKFRPGPGGPVAAIGFKGRDAFTLACKTGIAFCPYSDGGNHHRNWLFGYVREWDKWPWTAGAMA
ncbi:hypothetical protein [Cupriavidus sp. UYPR2.512]|uniref:hypothetical protein n=1 Tax=Cupriavidus sp. UYPR2.512 TaxID=1080187 RepID=UPI000371749C|nr:hypothetical protein [Cupriavidus sp. UYPR2.512]UIF90887.1 hypothetical protein KAF44_32380 [Cupriavidus necator]